tara:strand:- start:499 stop:2340 length:1842 start_codon:yes stop_codon:yes gene_type:complete
MNMKIPMITLNKNVSLKNQKLLGGYLLPASWLALVVCSLVFLPFYSSKAQEADGTNCPSTVSGLCTTGTFESSVSTTTETTQTDGTGTTTTTTTTTDTTTTTVTNPETGDLLTDSKVSSMGRNQRYGGDMTSDWGGQGSAKIRNNATCGDLGTDKCAEITGSGSTTSILGQTGIGSTYIQHIDMSSINSNINRGGQVPWSLRVEKRDANDSIHFRIRKTDGSVTTLLGTQTLSAAGATNAATNTLFQGNFNFSGGMTVLSIEVSGRDVNLAIGPLFDDVTVNVIYNVVNTIVSQAITSVEQFVALNVGVDDTTLEVAQDIFDNNNVGENEMGQFDIQPMGGNTDQGSQPSYESVSAEINAEIPTTELQAPTIEVNMPPPPPMEVQVEAQNVETEMQTEIQNANTPSEAPVANNSQSNGEPQGGTESSSQPESETTEPTESTNTEAASSENSGDGETTETASNESSEPESNESESKQSEGKVSEESKQESKQASSTNVRKDNKQKNSEGNQTKSKSVKQAKSEAKQKVANKIVKNMGDKGRYDSTNQLRTLVVMQVLGNTRSFFSAQKVLQDTPNFFQSTTVPDSVISDNTAAAYYMIGGSDVAHGALVNSQYK